MSAHAKRVMDTNEFLYCQQISKNSSQRLSSHFSSKKTFMNVFLNKTANIPLAEGMQRSEGSLFRWGASACGPYQYSELGPSIIKQWNAMSVSGGRRWHVNMFTPLH